MHERWKTKAPILVRVAMSLVVIWFGCNQLFKTDEWLGWLPEWAFNLPISPEAFIALNGAAEVVLGILLLVGLFTRWCSLLLGLHILGIAFSLGYNDTAIRDVGLSLATLSTFLHGPDSACADCKFKEKCSGILKKILYLFD